MPTQIEQRWISPRQTWSWGSSFSELFLFFCSRLWDRGRRSQKAPKKKKPRPSISAAKSMKKRYAKSERQTGVTSIFLIKIQATVTKQITFLLEQTYIFFYNYAQPYIDFHCKCISVHVFLAQIRFKARSTSLYRIFLSLVLA